MTERPQRVILEVQLAGLEAHQRLDSSTIESAFGRPLVTQSAKLTSATPSTPTSGTRQIADLRLIGACVDGELRRGPRTAAARSPSRTGDSS